MIEIVFKGIFNPSLNGPGIDPIGDGCGCCLCKPETQGAGDETVKHGG